MMISPEAYYNAYLKDRSIDEIKSSIRSLKREIGHLKNVMEHPDYMPTTKPDESTQLWCTRMYLERAIQALEETGETYSLSQTEIKNKKFNDNIPFITKIKFVIGGFAQGHNHYHLTISDDKIEKEFKRIPDDVIETVPFLIDKDEFLEQFSKLNIGEWRANYTTHKYGFLIDDGTQWALDIYYSNGARKKEFYGDNAYPYNFRELLELLEVEYECEDEELDVDYTIDLEDKDDLIQRMIDKAKQLPFNTEISTSQLLQSISDEVRYEDGCYIYDGVVLEMKDMFSLDYEFKVVAENYGIIIDDTIHADEVLGMPFHIGFLIKEY